MKNYTTTKSGIIVAQINENILLPMGGALASVGNEQTADIIGMKYNGEFRAIILHPLLIENVSKEILNGIIYHEEGHHMKHVTDIHNVTPCSTIQHEIEADSWAADIVGKSVMIKVLDFLEVFLLDKVFPKLAMINNIDRTTAKYKQDLNNVMNIVKESGDARRAALI